MPKKDLRDKLDDDELDLSLMNITDVPVKEIVAIPKGTTVDLSNNHISTLPANFVTLLHITKLDLSRNSITDLPSDFGKMKQLKHLDLYSNKLRQLPASFGQLKNLRWLDLKNNPLVPRLQEEAGDCVDQKQCEQCARQVVAFMAKVQLQVERERQAQRQAQQEREDKQRELEEKEREKIRAERKAKKEKKKQEQRETKRKEEAERVAVENGKIRGGDGKKNNICAKKPAAAEKLPRESRWSCLAVVNVLLLLALVVSVGAAVFVYTDGGNLSKESISRGWAKAGRNAEVMLEHGRKFGVQALMYGGRALLTVQRYSSKAVVVASHWGTVAGDVVVTRATQVINWSSDRCNDAKAYLDANGGDTWKVVSTTSAQYWGIVKNYTHWAWQRGQGYAVRGYDWLLNEGPQFAADTWLVVVDTCSDCWEQVRLKGPVFLDDLWQRIVSTALRAKETIVAVLKPADGKT